MSGGGPLADSHSTTVASRGLSSLVHTVSPQSLPLLPAAPADVAATFYFVVFPCNCAPIFHSNRIPFLNKTPPYVPGDVVCLGPAEEVAQQKLQELAFPLRFGCKSAGIQNGQFWSSRLESVRRRGDVRYHRLMITSTFVVLIASESGELRTMHTKYAAAALVITCPPDKPHYKFLLDNFDSVVRTMLHISLDFAMWATQHFFMKLSRTLPAERLVVEVEQHDKALETYCTLGSILANALVYTHAVPRMHSGIGEVTMTSPSCSSSRLNELGCVTKSVERFLYEALSVLCRFSETFATSVVAGLLSISNCEGYGLLCRHGGDGGGGGGGGGGEQQQQRRRRRRPCDQAEDDNDNDMYGDYWRNMEEPSRGMGSSGNSSKNNNSNSSGGTHQELGWRSEVIKSSSMTSSLVSGVMHSGQPSELNCATGVVAGYAVGTATAATAGSSSTPLLSHSVGRVVIFCTDPELASCLLILAAFFFRDRRTFSTVAASRVPDTTPFAGRVDSCAHPSLPVQWVMEEYDPVRVDRLLRSPHTVENVVLVVSPRTMVCRRLRLLKTFNTNPILVERFKTSHHPVRPFREHFLGTVEVFPDHVIRAALRKARYLQAKSNGAVNSAEFLELFVARLMQHIYYCHRLQQDRNESPSPSSPGLATPGGGIEEDVLCVSLNSCCSPLNSTVSGFRSSVDGNRTGGGTFAQKLGDMLASVAPAHTNGDPLHTTFDGAASDLLKEMRVGVQLMQLLTERYE